MLRDNLFVFSQHIAPQHLISKGAGKIADCEVAMIKNPLIEWFIKQYQVNMDEALESDPKAYKHFNDFFTRALKDGARSICPEKDIAISPVDGAISQLGKIKSGRIFQAKGHSFSTEELLGGDKERAAQFENGSFATIYLSPKDYHRIHMPISGELDSMTYIPGELFSVNPTTTENVSNLFARNERLAAIFNTEVGPVALVLVGAMIVASIETVWSGLAEAHGKTIQHTRYNGPAVSLNKGDEMGRFLLGSTVVMLWPEDTITFEEQLAPESVVRMGEAFGRIRSK